jgi:hypothetical protein
MPNILKRPMFRKGGSTADGVGITSGLSTRQNYSDGTPGITIDGKFFPYGEKDRIPQEAMDIGKKIANKPVTDKQKDIIRKLTTTSNTQTSYDPLSDPSFDIIRNRYQELLPTRETSLQDLVTALGATAPEDATKLQTIGQVLSKAGTTAAGLRQQREATAEGFKSAALTEVLKNMNAEDKDQLIRRAKLWAQSQRDAGKDMTDEQGIAIWLNAAISQGSPYLKGQSPQDRILDMAKDYADPDGEFGFSRAGAQQVSKIIVAYQDETLPPGIQERFKGPIDQEGALIATEDGGYEFRDIKQLDEIYYTPNRIYVNPDDGLLYEYIGEGQFQKVNQ